MPLIVARTYRQIIHTDLIPNIYIHGRRRAVSVDHRGAQTTPLGRGRGVSRHLLGMATCLSMVMISAAKLAFAINITAKNEIKLIDLAFMTYPQ